MLSREENELLTSTGPGTPCGEFMRRYWQPVALSEELAPGGSPIPLQIMGEELVLFRDEKGRIGLLDLHCSHRGADLSYGRIEDGGLRCLYHGFLYDVQGRCLETPNEPPESKLKDKICHKAYSCQEKGGVIFGYMGPGEPPLLPAYEVLDAPPERRITSKYYHECNYLQGLEGNIDSTHAWFLHGFRPTEEGVKMAAAYPTEDERKLSGTKVSRAFRQPKPGKYYGPVEVEETDFGLWADGRPQFILPSFCLTGGGPQLNRDGYMLFWRVPISDTDHWLFTLTFKASGPWDSDIPYQWTRALVGPDYHPYRNKANRYLQDREEQRRATFSGMGLLFYPQDACVNEGAGPIQDRTKEHLGVADRGITAARKLLLRSVRMVAEGQEPPGIIRDSEVNKVDPLFLKKNAPPSAENPVIKLALLKSLQVLYSEGEARG